MNREKIIAKLEKEVKRTYAIKTTTVLNGTKVSEEITVNREPSVRIPIEMADKILAMLKEQEETIRNLEQEIRDKNERLKERAEQVDSMLKEQKPVEPSRDIALNKRCPKCFAILKGKFCHQCGQAVKWDG